jgi:hypothetical protein
MGRVFDYIKIALIAFAGVWLINKGLNAAGLGRFAASPSNNGAGS